MVTFVNGSGYSSRGAAPTLADVARHAGVSTATVSRALAGVAGVGAATRRRVEAAADALGYVPDTTARALAGGSGDLLGLVVVASPAQFRDDPHFARVVAAAGVEASARALTLTVHVTDAASLGSVSPIAGDRRFVAALTVNVTPEMARELPRRARCPVVSLGRSIGSEPFVDPENEQGAIAAIEHLVRQGRRCIAMIDGPESNPCARERRAGYLRAMRGAGLRPNVLRGDFTHEGGRAAARRLAQASEPIDALFASSDLMAAGALGELTAAGWRVPDDVAIVGFDDSPPSRMTTPALSTVVQPVEEIVGLAVATALLGGSDRPHEQRVATQLLVRASSSP
jgi:DNA-binding LacI/PurR family transcriptional regulator